MKRGMSPLISEILLVVLVIMIAVVITNWLTTSTKKSTQQVTQTELDLIKCTNANMKILNYNLINSDLTVVIQNVGSVDLENVTVYAMYNGRLVGKNTTSSLGIAEIKEVPIHVSSTPTKIVAIPKNCPTLTIEKEI